MPDNRDSARLLLDQLLDARSRRVALVSHCLLNENTRYAGGATRPGSVRELVDELMSAGYGIHQLPCPERLAWGGVLKRRSLRLYYSKGGLLYPIRGALLAVFVWWTKAVYRHLARKVVSDIVDYKRAGIAVDGFLGIGSSPSCGILTTLDMHASLDVVAACPAAALTRDVMNERVVLGCRRRGQGLFVRALDRELARQGASVPAYEHDLVAELRGTPQTVLTEPCGRIGADRGGRRW